MQLNDTNNIADLAELARKRLPKVIFDYMEGGAEDEVTLRANRSAFEQYRFRPRILTGSSKRDLSITLFGQTFALPFLIGPTGLNGIHWRHADIHLARAAAEAGCGFTLSTAATSSLEEVAHCVSSPKWFQLYPWGERSFSARLIERAQRAGYSALVVTVDSLYPGRRERDARNKFAHQVRITPAVVWDGMQHPRWLMSVWLKGGMPAMPNVAEFLPEGADAYAMATFTTTNRNPDLKWEDLAWMRTQWAGPLLVKGVLTAEDALCAVQVGADGVVVSNHGGRQLDGSVATIEVLPEVLQAAGGNLTVLVDGGFRRGTDIVKALALGANGVLLGRATLYGVAAAGQAGAARAIAILREEVDRAIALLGCSSVGVLSPQHVTKVPVSSAS